MSVISLWERIRGKYQRSLAAAACRRPVTMQNIAPVISFTFDDFPRSALEVGGSILAAHGLVGTYYVALGLLDQDEAAGRMCSRSDVENVTAQGHELGCHTFGHLDPWETDPRLFESSILENRGVLERIVPGARFETMSYPISTTPRPVTKKRTGRYFSCCRGGGQGNNRRVVDLNYVYSFFLERARDQPNVIWELIERNRIEKGWLIFSTHDVAAQPSQYGCTPGFFEQVVRRAVGSGAMVLPVAQALSAVCGQAEAYMEETVTSDPSRVSSDR